jgi:hypothetical protein
MKQLTILALLTASTPAWALALSPITPHEALSNRGQCVMVAGVAGVRADPQRLGFDIDLDGKDSAAFGYILPGDQKHFPSLDSYAGKKIAITGVVNFYQGRAEITMTSPAQVSLDVPAPSAGLTHIGPEFAHSGDVSVCG